MAVTFIERGGLSDASAQEAIAGLYAREASVVVVRGASYGLRLTEDFRSELSIPWIERSGLYYPDRETELGGTAFFEDMPPHIDPHMRDSLKALVIDEGGALGRFVMEVPTYALDETNELPWSDYTPLEELGIEPDEVALDEGDAACFLGSVTLHEIVSISERRAYINSYHPL